MAASFYEKTKFKRVRKQNMDVIKARFNVISGVGSQLLRLLLNFIVRSVFIYYLGSENVGLNSLYTNILGLLSLAELGIGGAVIAHMYKPLAEGNNLRVKTLMSIYKIMYRGMAMLVIAFGLLLLPFIGYLTRSYNGNFSVYLVFMIYVLNTAVSYFFGYRQSILIADQKSYVVNITNTCIFVVASIAQLIGLIVWNSMYFFVIVMVLNTVAVNYSIFKYTEYHYQDLFENIKSPTKKDITSIIDYVKPMVLYQVSGVVNNGTDSLIISQFVSVLATGLYANYLMVLTSVQSLVKIGFSSLTASVGQLVHLNNKDRSYKLLENLILAAKAISFIVIVNFVGFVSIFIKIWLGEKAVLPDSTVILLAVSLYTIINSLPLVVYREATGSFIKRQYLPVMSVVINLVLSVTLVKYMGINGVIVGTVIARVATYSWNDPAVIIGDYFGQSIFMYFVKYLLDIAIVVIVSCMVVQVMNLLNGNLGIIFALLVEITFFFIFYRKVFDFIGRKRWKIVSG